MMNSQNASDGAPVKSQYIKPTITNISGIRESVMMLGVFMPERERQNTGSPVECKNGAGQHHGLMPRGAKKAKKRGRFAATNWFRSAFPCAIASTPERSTPSPMGIS